MTYPFGPTVTQISQEVTGTDADGNDVYSPTPSTYQAIAFAQNATVEVLGSQDTVTVDGILTVPPGTVVAPVDRFIVGTATYEVDGAPAEPISPWDGWNPGVVVKLKAVTG